MSLFGNAQQNNNQTQQGGGLFGSANKPPPLQLGNSSTTSQPQQSNSLFGSTQSSSQQQGTGLFGNTQTTGSGLFGTQQNQQPQSQQGGGLFGSATNQQSQPQQAGGLFASTSQQQGSGTGGLFRSNNTQQSQQTSLFGGSTLGQIQNQSQSAQGTGLFGSTQNKPTSQLNLTFPTLGASSQPQPTQQQQQKPSILGSSPFALSSNGQQQGGLGASTNNQSTNQSSLFGTRTLPSLTMGAANTNSQTSTSTVPGVKIDVSNIRGTTRFADLHEELQKQIEQISTFIQQQVSFKEQCDAIMPAHSSNLDTVPGDVEFISDRVDNAQTALDNDANAIKSVKDVVLSDADDARMSFRAVDILKLPQQYQYSGAWHGAASSAQRTVLNTETDGGTVDLVSYFSSKSDEMGKTLDLYKRNLAEIENHLGSVEASTMTQSQQLMFKRGRDGQGRSGEDQIAELGAVLRQFEGAILGVAEKVGGLRDELQAAVK